MGRMFRFSGLRSLDYIAFLLFVALVVGSVFWSSTGREGELRVEVEASGVLHILPLDTDRDLVLEGPVGETHIHVENGSVSISDSDCRDKICVAMGEVSQASGWIACLPNRVFVRVVAVGEAEPGESPGVDAGAF